MDDERMWQANAVALADRVGELVTRIRCAEAELGAVLVEIEARGVGELFGYRSVGRLLEDLADISADAAGKLLRRARALNSAPETAPATAAAARDGRLSNPMIDTILETLRQIPDEHRGDAEREMVLLSRTAGRRQVAALGAHLLGYLNPDGPPPDDTTPSVPERELSLRRKRTGVWELRGRFDDETGTRAHALLDSLAERRTAEDLRSPQERYGDAFSDAIDLALNSPDLPLQAGERAHVLVTVPLEALKTGAGTARLGDTGDISAADARVHACDSGVIPAVLGGKSEPLDLGRLRRLITAGLRRALYLRDRGCAFPGCHRPPRHCQGHHIRHWAEGGPTSLGNLVLLCGYHHRLVHSSSWQVRVAADGLPEFIPPLFMDRRRQPRRNNVHKPLPAAA
ncbi:DUF222 domain-containing protein [Amycolatopsis sp. NBC_00355]|uniref:HNH endonuclease signature motif containing protein n=1 Tax=Amycolatopsis sp. NBC_00355 TaxID=2975957 RepID=UPI003FA4C150